MNYRLSTPALNGEVVTEGHANYCAANGHMHHTVDGVEQGICPRCGEVTVTEEAITVERAVGDCSSVVVMSSGVRIGYASRVRGIIYYRSDKGYKLTVPSTDSEYTALIRTLSN